MFRSKKYVTLYSNHNATARSTRHENFHSKLYTKEDNNSFTGLYKSSNKAYYLQEALNNITHILFFYAYSLS